MQSPMDPGLMISSDFSSELLDSSIVIRDPETRCQDAMANKTGINRLERKVDHALRKVTVNELRLLSLNTYIYHSFLARQYSGSTKEAIAKHPRQRHPDR